MTKKQNVFKYLLTFLSVAILISGIYLCVLIPTLNSTQKTNNFDEPELILQDEADFVIDGNGTFTSFSADAKSKINDVETFGVILPAKVKEIGGGISESDGPFYSYRTKLISVEFAAESELTTIGKYAFFRCSSLTSITIPDGVTSIGSHAFRYCSGLETVEISQDASLRSIANSVFWDCSSLTSINIPDGVTSIGEDAFRYCSGLETVEISQDASLQSIENYAFDDCSSLTSITIPDGVTNIGSSAFSGCSGLETVEISQDASLQSIGNLAFSRCSNLTSINIPEKVSSIGNNAFYDCSSLTSIFIPENVTSIGNYAFGGCSGLQTITVAAGNEKYKDYGKNVIVDTSSNTLIVGCSNSSIPDEVTKIGQNAFYGCSHLTNITIPENVTSIGGYAFKNCVGLTSITIPENVTSIDLEAFMNCSGLQTITVAEGNQKYKDYGKNVIVDTTSNTLIVGCNNSTIPDEVTKIGQSVFENCVGLTSITIPENVTTISSYAFRGCSGLQTITVAEGNEKYKDYGKNVIVDTSSNTLVLGCVNSIIPDEVTKIGKNAFYGSGLTNIFIPENVTSIGGYAFENCVGLTSITIPDNVTSIGVEAFAGSDNVIFIAESKESAEKFQTNSSYHLTSYKDRITYVIDIKLQKGEETITLKKLYKQDATWCLQENGAWEKVDDYQLPYSQEGSWQDSEGNTVTLSDLNDKLKNGEIEEGYVLNFTENDFNEQEPEKTNQNLLWILIGVLGGALVVAAGLTVVLVAYKKKEKQK